MNVKLCHRSVSQLAVLATLFAIGCGGGGTNPPAKSPEARNSKTAPSGSPGYDCASLISEQDIDHVIGLSGTKLVSGVRGDQNEVLPGHTQCGYGLPQDFTLGINVYSGTGSGEGLETFDAVWTLAQSQGAEALDGIGDSALIQTNFPAGPRVLVRAKGRGVIVDAGGSDGLGKLNLNDVVKRIVAIVVGRV